MKAFGGIAAMLVTCGILACSSLRIRRGRRLTKPSPERSPRCSSCLPTSHAYQRVRETLAETSQQLQRSLGISQGNGSGGDELVNSSSPIPVDSAMFEVVTTGLGYPNLMKLFAKHVLPVIEKNLNREPFHQTHFDQEFPETDRKHGVYKRYLGAVDMSALAERERLGLPYLIFDLANVFSYQTDGASKVAGTHDYGRELQGQGWHVNALYIGFLPDWGTALLTAFESSDFVLFKRQSSQLVETYVDRILLANWKSFPPVKTGRSERGKVKKTCREENDVEHVPDKCWFSHLRDFCAQMFRDKRVYLRDLVKAYACANDEEESGVGSFDKLSNWLWNP